MSSIDLLAPEALNLYSPVGLPSWSRSGLVLHAPFRDLAETVEHLILRQLSSLRACCLGCCDRLGD